VATTSGAKTLNNVVYSQLRDLIVSNELRAGQKLVDRELAERLRVSRTPVREALGRLAVMGLVEARNRRGFYVCQYTAEQMSDLYAFRKILEVNAARMAAENAKPEHLRDIDRILSELETLAKNPDNRAKTVEVDLQIHDLISRASGNDSLLQASRQILDKILCFIWVDWMDSSVADPASISAAHREHRELLLAVKERDPERAASLMSEHIGNAQAGLAKLLQNRAELRGLVLSAT
jgi:DNA-binding GntR family transcriptional regulator